DSGVFPQSYVNRAEAQAACGNAGKRLCSRGEWMRACQGESRTHYPYAEHEQPNRCNKGKPHLLTIRFGADSRRWRYDDFNDPALSQEPGFLAPTGAYEGCVGDAGAYDLVGNLHEWVNDKADRAFMARLESEVVTRGYQPWQPGNGVFMGGF